jgi:Domain of unknown function (DUF4232)/Ricin-type beta-trefoil lectin domain
MTTTRSAAALAAAACLAVLTGCGGHAAAPGAGASRSPSASTTAPAGTPATVAPATTAPGGHASAPRCRTSQLSLAFTGFNEASGGQRGMTLILANRSGTTCYVYGYPGLAFYNGSGFPMTTRLTWPPQPHTRVLLRPAGNAQAWLTWRANTATGTAPFHPDLVHVTPPDEYAYLWAIWPGGPVRGGDIAAGPLRAAPAGPFPAGTGTIVAPFNGMCMTVAADGTTVELRTCSPGAGSQQWTGYSDGTLRTGGRCLDVTGPGAGAKVQAAACTGAASQKWEIGQVSYNDFGAIANAGTGTVLSYPRGSIADGTPLVTGPDLGDQSSPWHVSFRPYMT